MPPTAQRMQCFVPPSGSPGYLDDLAILNLVQEKVEFEYFNDVMVSMKNTLIGLFQTPSGRKIKHFIQGFDSWPFITSPCPLRLALFEHLNALEVRIPFDKYVDEHMSGLQDTLSRTPRLEKLVLVIGPTRARTYSDVLEGFRPSLPKLEHFEIRGGSTTEYSLISLFTQFIGSLRSLRLDSVSLIDQPLGQQITPSSQMLSIFLSEEWGLARVTLTDLSYFHRDKRSRIWLIAQYLLSIQDAISYKAALPENEAYDGDGQVHRYTRPSTF